MNLPPGMASHHQNEACSPSSLLDGPWQVLHVRSNFEKRVAQHLAARSIEHYLPLYQERVRRTDRSVIVERPLFAGYVFARYPAPSRITVISTPGIVRALGDEPGSLVSGAELERIHEGLSTGLLLRPHPHVSVGTRVRVRNGVFAGIEGIVAELRQRCKVVICVAVMQKCFSLEADMRDLELVRGGSAAPQSPASDASASWKLRTEKI